MSDDDDRDRAIVCDVISRLMAGQPVADVAAAADAEPDAVRLIKMALECQAGPIARLVAQLEQATHDAAELRAASVKRSRKLGRRLRASAERLAAIRAVLPEDARTVFGESGDVLAMVTHVVRQLESQRSAYRKLADLYSDGMRVLGIYEPGEKRGVPRERDSIVSRAHAAITHVSSLQNEIRRLKEIEIVATVEAGRSWFARMLGR